MIFLFFNACFAFACVMGWEIMLLTRHRTNVRFKLVLHGVALFFVINLSYFFFFSVVDSWVACRDSTCDGHFVMFMSDSFLSLLSSSHPSSYERTHFIFLAFDMHFILFSLFCCISYAFCFMEIITMLVLLTRKFSHHILVKSALLLNGNYVFCANECCF